MMVEGARKNTPFRPGTATYHYSSLRRRTNENAHTFISIRWLIACSFGVAVVLTVTANVWQIT